MNYYTPQQVGIELVKGCNFTCQMCPVPLYREVNAWEFMSLDMVEQIVSEIEKTESVKTIWLVHFGEPLAHPKLRECLEIISRVHRKFRRQVILHTNASLLQKEKVAALLETDAVTDLTFSFDGFGDKESFELLRGPHYDKVLHNISEFSKLARQKKPDLKLLTCSVMPKASELSGWEGEIPNYAEVTDNFKQVFEPLGVMVQHREMIDFSGNEDLPITGKKQESIFGGCHFVEQDSLYFAVTGKVQPCCAVFNEDFNMGSIEESNFQQLLNNEPMNALRHDLRLDQRDNLEFCKNCSLSVGGDKTESKLREFWTDRHPQHPLLADEKKHIFGILEPESLNDTQMLLSILQDRVNHLDVSVPVGSIDSVKLHNKMLTISAWAADQHDAAPLTDIHVFIDKQPYDIADIRFLPRADVARHWGNKQWLYSGIEIDIAGVESTCCLVEISVKNSTGENTMLTFSHN
jgi:radical SAM protein with 4Fe4S-binding SPASM domain